MNDSDSDNDNDFETENENETKCFVKKRGKGRPKGKKKEPHPPEVISVEKAKEQGLEVPEEITPNYAVKAGNLVIWIPQRAKYRTFPGILTEQAKFVADQTIAIPIGFDKKHWMHLHLGTIIRNECLAQFYTAIAQTAVKTPPKKVCEKIAKRMRRMRSSKAGRKMTPKKMEAIQRMTRERVEKQRLKKLSLAQEQASTPAPANT